jgi:hypothetical protein
MAALSTLGAVALGAGALGSAAIGSSASRSAGRQVQQSTDAAANLQNQQFQQLLRLQMPSYQRSQGAADYYSRLLGIPGASQGQAMPMNYGQPGMMTGQAGTGAGWQARMGGSDFPGGIMTGGGYFPTQQEMPSYAGGAGAESFGGPQINPGVGPGGESFDGPQINPGVPGGQPMPGGQVQGQPQPGVSPGGTGQGQQSMYDYIRNLPGYQDQLQQGIGAIDRAASARGSINSGQRMKALNDYGQRTFGGFYNDYLNRVGQMAGQAPVIAQGLGQQGMNYASNVGNLMVQGGQARAQGSMGAAQSWQGGISDLAGIGGWYGGQRGWV